MRHKSRWVKFIPVSALLIIGILYFTFQRFTSADKKSEIIKIVKVDYEKNKSDFQTIADFFINTKTYSIDWQIENHPKQGLKYYSFTDFDSCKISFSEYKHLYYKDISHSTSPCYVPDFEILSNFESLTRLLHIRSVRTLINNECESKIVIFKYDYRYFFPTERITNVLYFPEGICANFISKNDKDQDDLTWAVKLNDNWLIQSSVED